MSRLYTRAPGRFLEGAMYIAATKLMIGAIATAGLVASLAVFFTSVAPEAKAGSAAVENSVHKPSAKGDRLPLLSKRPVCSLRAWPNYDRACQFDVRSSTEDTRSVRIIALR